MALISGLKSALFRYIKVGSVLHRRRFPSSFYVVSTAATITTKAFLITRTYQSSPDTLTVQFSDSLLANFHYAWLRDSCPCRQCVHPLSQQKLFDTISMNLDITPRSSHVTENGELKIVWIEKDDEHISMYDPFWLHKYALGFENNLYETVHDFVTPTKCWRGKTLEENLPEVEYEDFMQSRIVLNSLLDYIHKYGILFMRNVPCEAGEVVKVMNRITHIKETRWGSSFHITTDDTYRNPSCIMQTEKPLNLHTDMDYLEKSPGIQAIHCLESNYDTLSSETRNLLDDTLFADGFYTAEWLKKKHPVYFNTLASVPVKFRLVTENMEYLNYQPILRLNKSRHIAEVHFNNRLMAPLEGPSKSILPFYAAYKTFGEHVQNPENLYNFVFKPGDLVIINNRRVLHGGHTLKFSKIEKHLEGCFADLDEILARYRSFLMKNPKRSEKNK